MALNLLQLEEIPSLAVALPMHRQLEKVLRTVTEHSDQPYERAVHRLLDDMVELVARAQLDTMTYQTALMTAVDVLFFFNFEPQGFAMEAPSWYRASLVHQMGHGMLQALERFRPELTGTPFFQEALAALSIDAMLAAPPLRCRNWAQGN